MDDYWNTSWASGPEAQVRITLPLPENTAVNQIAFGWNDQIIPGLGHLGPAAQYQIFARDENTGQTNAVPFFSQGPGAGGVEIVNFGTSTSPNTVLTDQLTILLVGRQAGVDYYSLSEMGVNGSSAAAMMRIPTAPNSVYWNGYGTYSVLRAFDGDLNTQWAGGLQGAVAAVNVHGSNLKFTNLKVIGFGSKVGSECFLVQIYPYSGSITNVLVEDCLFTQPAPVNSEGLSTVTAMGIGQMNLENAIVRRCTVAGVRSHFLYSHAFGAPRVENCLVDDCQTAVYFEPGSVGLDTVGSVFVRSNTFLNVDQGFYLFFHAAAHFDSLYYQGNEIVLNPGETGYGIGACDVCLPGPSGTITNLLALNNVLRYADWAPRPDSLKGGVASSDIHHAVYGNNVVALGGRNSLRLRDYPAGFVPYPPSVDILPSGYRRAWFNNLDLSGTLLPVRFYNSGVDGLASQQQWPQ
jgi:hypothetical protein